MRTTASAFRQQTSRFLLRRSFSQSFSSSSSSSSSSVKRIVEISSSSSSASRRTSLASKPSPEAVISRKGGRRARSSVAMEKIRPEQTSAHEETVGKNHRHGEFERKRLRDREEVARLNFFLKVKQTTHTHRNKLHSILLLHVLQLQLLRTTRNLNIDAFIINTMRTKTVANISRSFFSL